MDNKPSRNGIQVHVIQFLCNFFPAPYIEIIEASLPEMRFYGGVVSPNFFKKVARNALLQNLQRLGRISLDGFRHEEVNMFRHHHISDQAEHISIADFG